MKAGRRIVVVIPARWASTRFPGKPLANIAGKPMIQRVYERVSQARDIDEVLVATDDERISGAVATFGGRAVLTPSELPSGTDRTAFVARQLQADILVNVQGDEPLIDPAAVEMTANLLLEDETADLSTLARRVKSVEDLENPNKVRVVLDRFGHALYFSRAVIPYLRDVKDSFGRLERFPYLEHIGIYGYRREALFQLTALPPSSLEEAERLEQLRALENGMTIKVGICDFVSQGVDTPEDAVAVERMIREREL
ncbi:MAG: 3-deoxy-manno-octulosonate cytidylyltransferase [candidate division KSB1 bacterium]|nr:3-deoxy-manno-octulosonate cytidylyltransferase [candidate division KSB1 bacterium]